MRQQLLWTINPDGGLEYSSAPDHIGTRFAPDAGTEKAWVAALLAVLFLGVDFSRFYAMLSVVCYDSTLMLCASIVGLAITFDVLPHYLALEARRFRQGLSRSRSLLLAALLPCLLGCVLNCVLAYRTETMPVQTLRTSFLGSLTEKTSEAETDYTMILFNAALPVLTSIASFVVSYLCFDPLRIRIRRLERLITASDEEMRKLRSTLADYEADPAFEERLLQDNRAKFMEAKRLVYVRAEQYAVYVRQRLLERLQDPTAANILAREDIGKLMRRLNAELTMLDELVPSDKSENSEDKVAHFPASSRGAA